MTRREELLMAPKYTGNEKLDDCFGLWIIPTTKLHDSGYRCMIIVVGYMDNGVEKYVRCEGHIDHLWGNDYTPKTWSSFSIDCDGGVLHLYHYGKSFKVDWWGTSSFEINPNHRAVADLKVACDMTNTERKKLKRFAEVCCGHCGSCLYFAFFKGFCLKWKKKCRGSNRACDWYKKYTG